MIPDSLIFLVLCACAFAAASALASRHRTVRRR